MQTLENTRDACSVKGVKMKKLVFVLVLFVLVLLPAPEAASEGNGNGGYVWLGGGQHFTSAELGIPDDGKVYPEQCVLERIHPDGTASYSHFIGVPVRADWAPGYEDGKGWVYWVDWHDPVSREGTVQPDPSLCSHDPLP